MTSKKLCGDANISSGCVACVISTVSPGRNECAHCPSTVRITPRASAPNDNLIVCVALSTSGRLVNACAQIGVTAIAACPGTTIGPPAAMLYAVDPVGV